MRAVEVTGVVDAQGDLSFQEPVPSVQGTVRVIILYPELPGESEQDPDNTSKKEIKASLRRALQEARSGQRIPLF